MEAMQASGRLSSFYSSFCNCRRLPGFVPTWSIFFLAYCSLLYLYIHT